MHSAIEGWIEEMRSWLMPENVNWVLDPQATWKELTAKLVEQGIFRRLNSQQYDDCFWTRSHSNDVARVEDRTFICTAQEDQAGPTNNWREEEIIWKELRQLMSGCMRGRTMYVIPYCMGSLDSPYARLGFELTDSPVTVAHMLIMTRAGQAALDQLPRLDNRFVKGVHSSGTLSPEQRYVCHFPQQQTIISYNSDYGGNALQGKKCFALRIASWMGKQEGWLAEHMLIMGVTNPEGEKHYLCAAFPSACGKTNLAMMLPAEQYRKQGWKIEVVGDDIAWIHIGKDGRLYAINPEAGFFGVAPGTSETTNPAMMRTINRHTIFTNTALIPESNMPWWEGLSSTPPARFIDWLGKERSSISKEKPAAHPNSRFTAPAFQSPVISSDWEKAEGVPISAIIFGGRRSSTVPLILEALSWQHGVYLGVSMSSETTAAASGEVGRLRRDPLAMLPFIGYNACDYFAHWLDFENRIISAGGLPPKIFQANWFRRSPAGQFLWPGFGENIRVLEWIIARIKGLADAKHTAVGNLPLPGAINTSGIKITEGELAALLTIDQGEWRSELEHQRRYLQGFGSRLPRTLLIESKRMLSELNK